MQGLDANKRQQNSQMPPSSGLGPQGIPHTHPTEASKLATVFALRACPLDLASDLLAIGGESFLEILQQACLDQVSDTLAYKLFASVHLGARVTAIAWSPVLSLHLLVLPMRGSGISQAANQTISITTFGGDAAGHKGKINDICFCIAGDAEGKYLASVGDDKACVLWDLYPAHAKEDYAQEFAEDAVSLSPADIAQSSSPFAFRAEGDAPTSNSPLAYPIYFGKPLHTVSSHPANARSILASHPYLVSDAGGTVSLINWMDLESELEPSIGVYAEVWRGHRVTEFIDPNALARNVTGMRSTWGGGASWKHSDPDLFGATYGPNWLVWSQKRSQGGKPLIVGEGFLEGGHRFRWGVVNISFSLRWCPTNSRLFAICTTSPAQGAVIKSFDSDFPTAPRTHVLAPRPHRVRDFDWIGSEAEDSLDSPAWMAVAVGKRVLFLAAGYTDQ
ncbi:hypothetical protein BS47DRAFT_1387784 [Hydnum rufescens UP504]|uniref:Uncharacterized protein n=1 Tax=Hydnum rufescens UP504 TaxID=1448309 RepID=A0A9P6B9A1_9AGAM|nr:hypothetical protein BS47DRAFT_1387784 [Hydnum rufescens UP504]